MTNKSLYRKARGAVQLDDAFRPPRLVLPVRSATDALSTGDELFRAMATRLTAFAEDSPADIVSVERSERQLASAFHCLALLARLKDTMELKDQQLARLKHDLSDAYAALGSIQAAMKPA